jgi:murein DD-endopeptidase MepM/ murein hydrolase activator NlpD
MPPQQAQSQPAPRDPRQGGLHRAAAEARKTQKQKKRRRKEHPRASWFGRFLTQCALALGVFTGVAFGGVDHIVHFHGKKPATPIVQTAEASAPDPTIAWTVDINGDGVADLANPCSNMVRGEDAFGFGNFEASRDAGARKHHGTDIIAAPGAIVRAPIEGEVTKMGAVYRNSEKLRFVEITNEHSKLTTRVMYVTASVGIGDQVSAGEPIGFAQDLQQRYPGITNHVHVELRSQGRLLNPADYLPFFPGEQMRAQLPAPARS